MGTTTDAGTEDHGSALERVFLTNLRGSGTVSRVADQSKPQVDEPTFGLDEMLFALRSDLAAANASLGEGAAILNVGSVELEVAFTLERATEKGGGLNFKVFGVGIEGAGKGTTGRTYANKIKLTLTPTGGPFGVAGGPEATR